MISRNLDGERREPFTIVSVQNHETGEELARLPEHGSLSVPDEGETVRVSLMELVESDGDELQSEQTEMNEYVVEERIHDYTLLELEGDEAEDIPEGDQLYTFVHLSVSEANSGSDDSETNSDDTE
jgi:hypothetical protein